MGSAVDIEPADLHKAEELLGKVVIRSAQVPHLTHLRRIEKTANYANGIAWPAVIIAVATLVTLGAVFVFLGIQYMSRGSSPGVAMNSRDGDDIPVSTNSNKVSPHAHNL